MTSLFEFIATWHAKQPHLLSALLAGSLVSTVCGVLGCFIILRRMAFLGDAIAHTMLAGVTCGYLLMKLLFGSEANAPAMLLGAIISGFLTVVMIGFVSRLSRIKDDTAIGIMYTGIFAVGGMLASLFSHVIHVDLLHFMTGNVLAVDSLDLWLIAVVAVVVFAVVILFFRQLQLISFDPVMAASIGVHVVLLDYVLTACTSLVVVSAVNIVGVILVVGLLVTPAATAYLLCDRLSRMLWVAAILAETSFLAGYWLSSWLNVAPGAAIVVAATLQFLVVLLVAPRYGLLSDWLRRRGAVPQRLIEDVLSCVLKAPSATVSFATVTEFVHEPADAVRRAIAQLERQGMLNQDQGNVTLTDVGLHEARRLLRAHRLWETYLQRLGTPEAELHAKAHELEHLHDEEAVDYLDDKLGHPLVDPHGAEIPEDFVHLVPGAEVSAALLREGRRAEVIRVGPASGTSLLREGMQVTAGARQAGGLEWVLLLPGGGRVVLDHDAADAVLVRVLEESK